MADGNIKQIKLPNNKVYDLVDVTAIHDSLYVHTDNNYTTTEKNKLAGIDSGAEVNVQSDWNVTDSSSKAFIKNKPTIQDMATKTWVNTQGFLTLATLPIYQGAIH